MSFHKLKLGARKKDPTKPTVLKQQKFKQKNQDFIQPLTIGMKSQQKRTNIISMSNDFQNQIFALKKTQLHSGSKTDRLHKIQRIQFSAENNKKSRQTNYHFNYSNTQENQQYTASKLIDFLSIQPSSQNKTNDVISNRSIKTSKQNDSNPRKTENKKTIQESHIHGIKLINFNEQETSVCKSSRLKHKAIELQQTPLNYQTNSNEDHSKRIKKQEKNIVLHRIKKSDSVYSQTSQLSNHQNPMAKSLIVENSFHKNEIQLQKVSQSTKNNQQKLKQSIQNSQVTKNTQISANKPEKVSFVQSKTQKPLIADKRQKNNAPSVLSNNLSQVQQKEQININLITQKQQKLQVAVSPKKSQKSNSVEVSPKQQKQKLSPYSQKSKQQQSKIPIRQNVSPLNTQQYISSPVKSKINYKPINEVQLAILQQNKTLTQEVQKLRKQRDELLFLNKRYQVQLLQSNCKQYYQREIQRLKKQVESLQCSQEEFKHLNFILQNKNKQLQSSEQLNKKQLKKLIKQLEQIKIQSTKQKYQLKQKGSSLQNLIKQLQQRNADLSAKFQQYYKKFQELQKNYKAKSQEQIRLINLCNNLQTKIVHLEKSASDKIRHYQNQINRYSYENVDLRDQYRNFKRQSESQVQILKQNIKQLSLKRQSEALLIQSRTKSLQKHNNKIQAQLQVVRMEETIKQLEMEIQKRSELIRQLNQRLDSMISMNDYEEMRKQLEASTQSRAVMKQQYQIQILKLSSQIERLRSRIQQNQNQLRQRQHIVLNVTKKAVNGKLQPIQQKQNFQQILKQQIVECDSLRQQIFKKSQQLFQSKQQNQQLKIKLQTLKNQQQILKKQFTSQQNNSKVKKQILEQQLISQIDSMKRKMTMLEKRYESKIKQNKQKQSFIQNYIIGKTSNQSDAHYLIKELQRVFLQNEKKILAQ